MIGATFTCGEFTRLGELPFASVGMMIDAGDGNYREVTDVMWNCRTNQLDVGLVYDDGEFDLMLAWGWRALT